MKFWALMCKEISVYLDALLSWQHRPKLGKVRSDLYPQITYSIPRRSSFSVGNISASGTLHLGKFVGLSIPESTLNRSDAFGFSRNGGTGVVWWLVVTL